MRIRYFATLRDVAQKSEEPYDAQEIVLLDLLNRLCSRYGREFRRWVMTDDGKLSEMAIILVNGRDVRELEYADTVLRANDVICMFPPIAGG